MPTYSLENTRKYLEQLEVPLSIARKATDGIAEFTELSKLEPQFVFLEDIINDDGRREFIGVVLFTETTWSEISLLTDGGMWTASINKSIGHIVITERKNIKGEEVGDSSRLSLQVVYINGSDANLNATGLNCNELITIYRGYLLPMLINR